MTKSYSESLTKAMQNAKRAKDRKISISAHSLLMVDMSENDRLRPSNMYNQTRSVVAWKERIERLFKKNKDRIIGTLFSESQKWCGRIGAITASHSTQ
nr:hypothetical protein [Candidatus Ichthyocystis hellenicum]